MKFNFKKLFSLILVIPCILGLTACAANEDGSFNLSQSIEANKLITNVSYNQRAFDIYNTKYALKCFDDIIFDGLETTTSYDTFSKTSSGNYIIDYDETVHTKVVNNVPCAKITKVGYQDVVDDDMDATYNDTYTFTKIGEQYVLIHQAATVNEYYVYSTEADYLTALKASVGYTKNCIFSFIFMTSADNDYSYAGYGDVMVKYKENILKDIWSVTDSENNSYSAWMYRTSQESIVIENNEFKQISTVQKNSFPEYDAATNTVKMVDHGHTYITTNINLNDNVSFINSLNNLTLSTTEITID